jgi:hypothetical protein
MRKDKLNERTALELTCLRHLTKSSGVTRVWVRPQERAPPAAQAA